MGYGIDEVIGLPFGILTSKAPGNPIGATVWVVGKTTDSVSPIYLACSFIVDTVRASKHPDFLYEYLGEQGENYEPLRCVSDQHWYPKLLRLTGNFRFGLTELSPDVLNGLLTVAAPIARRKPIKKQGGASRRKRR
jgi:hypothetical protein